MRFDVSSTRAKAAVPSPGSLAPLGTLLTAALCAGAAWSAPMYRIEKLPLLAGDPASQASIAHAINQQGDVAGTITTYTVMPDRSVLQDSRGVIWPAGGGAPIKLKNPPERPNDNVVPWAINSSRVVVGDSIAYTGADRYPFAWAGKRAMRELPNAGRGEAVGVNDANVAVGYSQDTYRDAPAYPTYWTRDGKAHQVSTTPGHLRDINNVGSFLGNEYGDVPYVQPYLRDAAGKVTLLGNLPGQTPTYGKYAWAMSNKNVAVGGCDKLGVTLSGYVSCMWLPDGTAVDLGLIDDGRIPSKEHYTYQAWGVNSKRQVVGYYTYITQPNSVTHMVATYWDPKTGLVELRKLLDPSDPLYAQAYAEFIALKINEDGVIVGNFGTGLNGAVRLVPVASTARQR